MTPQVRRGVVYQTRALLRRPMLVIGVLLAASMVIAESFFVAAVTVDGYRAIPESALRDCLAASGVREGVYRPGIDWGQAEAALFETFPQIMWVRLVYDGRLVVLEVAETGHQIIRGESELAADEEKLFIPARSRRTAIAILWLPAAVISSVSIRSGAMRWRSRVTTSRKGRY